LIGAGRPTNSSTHSAWSPRRSRRDRAARAEELDVDSARNRPHPLDGGPAVPGELGALERRRGDDAIGERRHFRLGVDARLRHLIARLIGQRVLHDAQGVEHLDHRDAAEAS
jgi:hypothetical protein